MPRANYADPVTFRPKTPEARALLEAVATVRGLSVSKFVAESAERSAVEFVRKMGKEEFAARLEEIEARQQRLRTQFMASLDEELDGLDNKSGADDNPMSNRTNSHIR